LAPRKRKLSTTRIKEFGEHLLSEKERILRTLDRMDAKANENLKAEDTVDTDDAAADAALHTIARGTDMALEENLRILLQEVQAAEEKLQKGTYGLCDNCGIDIKIARLERIPWATMCVECQGRLERR